MLIDELLSNDRPVNFELAAYAPLFERLQGNILKGHGRDFAAHLFIRLTGSCATNRRALAWVTERYVTSAYDQLVESRQYRRLGVPGRMHGSLFLTTQGYGRLGFAEELPDWFPEERGHPNTLEPHGVTFLNGMFAARKQLGDSIDTSAPLEPLEEAYLQDTIDAMILLADDSERRVRRQVRALLHQLRKEGVAAAVAVEWGRVLRNAAGEGVEHFGYVDGRSQPRFLTDDFDSLGPLLGHVVPIRTRERSGDTVRWWNPFAPLSLALMRDPGTTAPFSCGSYYVFRKLEQDVCRFRRAEEELACALGLANAEIERAGAMAVGRFRDGTPIVLSSADGWPVRQTNDFRYDALDAELRRDANSPADRLGLKCPFHAHIRKMNPRQSVDEVADQPADVLRRERDDRSRAIVRRGITYGKRRTVPEGFNPLNDVPLTRVGLLFACYQRSIARQFAFVQKRWANAPTFKVQGEDCCPTGLDPLVGRPIHGATQGQRWRREYGGLPGQEEPRALSGLKLSLSHPVGFNMADVVKFRGGAFFFAPSLPFLLDDL